MATLDARNSEGTKGKNLGAEADMELIKKIANTDIEIVRNSPDFAKKVYAECRVKLGLPIKSEEVDSKD